MKTHDSRPGARIQRPAAEPDRPRQRAAATRPLPEGLRAGIEAVAGEPLPEVRVHHDSPQPAQLQAHAFTQGSDIHLGPGQERHLAHEAWHVVQQMQGRVKPTLRAADGTAVNDEVGLEREADAMGRRAGTVATTK